ncbi:MAG: Rrf2 family transcriptional regulator [Bacteroidales bacterium]
MKSNRGRGSGFYLVNRLTGFFLCDIIDSVEGLDVFATCIMGFRECPFDNQCAMHETWTETRNNIINILKTTSLADFRIKR